MWVLLIKAYNAKNEQYGATKMFYHDEEYQIEEQLKRSLNEYKLLPVDRLEVHSGKISEPTVYTKDWIVPEGKAEPQGASIEI